MKLARILVLPGVFVMIVLLQLFLPTEEEREAKKRQKLPERNFLEKQLVGKWNHSDFPAGLENNRNYHLLSADASYTYRASDSSKRHGKDWSVQVADSILYLNSGIEGNSKAYKIIKIETDHITLHQMENDSLTTVIEWFRHP